MGSLFVEIGQCGCQIGAQLNPRLSNSYYCTRNRPPYRLHGIMVDTQPKVLLPFLQKQPQWLDPLNVKYFQYGRGNNWSYGYLDHIPQKRYNIDILAQHKQYSHLQPNSLTLEKYITENRAISDYIMDRVRKQLQTVDCAMVVNVLASLGGGTGSGLGTKIIERLSEQFKIDVYSHLVLPNKSGQTPLQVYNCLLSLASIQQHSTAIFTYQNDKIIQLFHQNSGSSSLDDINSHLASAIAKMVKINDIQNYDRFYTQAVGECVLSNQLKYLNLFASQSTQWDQTFGKMFEQLKNYHCDRYGQQFSKKQKKQYLLHGELMLLGKSKSQYQQKFSKKTNHILNPMFQDSLNVQHIPNSTYSIARQTEKRQTASKIIDKRSTKQDNKCEALLIQNHSSINHYLSYLHVSGAAKYQAKAYLWHYQYADLQSALNSMANVVEQYHYFTHS